MALVAIQRSKCGRDGTLAASLLYVSAKDAGQLTDNLKECFVSELSEKDKKLDDVSC